MQGPTHLGTGVLIQLSTRSVRAGARYPLIAILALASHALLDKFAQFTYHPPTAVVDDWFWVAYHSLILFLTFFLLKRYWSRAAVGIVFSFLPDIEWVVLYGSQLLSIKIPFWTEPILHNAFLGALDRIPPFCLLGALPDWRLKPVAALVETVILLVLFAGIYSLNRRHRPSSHKSRCEACPVGTEARSDALSWEQRLGIFQRCMDHEQSIRMGYQRLLTSLEVAILGLGFTFIQLELLGQFWVLPLAGIALCVILGAACEFRARNVDRWRRAIIVLVRGTTLEHHFKEAQYGHPTEWHPFFSKESLWGKIGRRGDALMGHWFERGVVPAMMVIWLVVAWIVPTPFLLRFFCTVATWTWVIVNFQYAISSWWAWVVESRDVVLVCPLTSDHL